MFTNRKKRENALGSILFVLLLTGVSSRTLNSQAIQGPSLGVLFDSASGEFKPIVGIVGAAIIAKPFPLEAMKTAVVCSSRGFALSVTQAGGRVVVVSFRGGTVTASSLDVVAPNPDRLILSPTCSSAAVIYNAGSRARLLTGLPNQPAGSDIDLSALPSTSGAAAVDDTGSILLLSIPGGRGSMVQKLNSSGARDVLLDTASVSAMAFFNNSQDAAIADASSNQLFIVRNTGSAPVVSPIANKAGGVVDAAALAVSSDNHHVIVANATNRSVAVVNTETGSGVQVNCHCEIDGIHALTSSRFFRLSNRTDRPISIVDLGGETPQLSWIPAQPSSVGGDSR
jgi:hypothetical protein